MAETVRTGVFGSAFNPPHLAHLIFVIEARWQLGLDRVVLVPTGDSYHKEVGSDPGPEVRLAMAVAMADGVDGLEVSEAEIRRPGPSYTCDTLEALATSESTGELYLLMGGDAARDFTGWHQPSRILELARIGVAPRPGTERAEVERVFEELGATDRIEFIAMPQIEISSRQVRERARAGEPFAHLLPTAVSQMIHNGGTYGIK